MNTELLLWRLGEWATHFPIGADEAIVILGSDITLTAVEASRNREPKAPIPASARLFTKKMRVLAWISSEGEPLRGTCLLFEESQEGFVMASVYLTSNTYQITGRFRAGDLFVESDAFATGDPAVALLVFAYLLDLINTPRFTVQTPLPRPARRRLNRAGAKTDVSDRIRVISWNLTKPKLEADETMGSGRHMPLHYTRGHWRQCAAHLDRAHLHDDGASRMWIEGFWSGHPAYGTVRAIYAPKL